MIDYIEQADKLLVSFGATTERFMPDNTLKAECLKYDLHMSQAQLKHLGTDENFDTMRKMIEYIAKKCDIYTDSNVTDVDASAHTIFVQTSSGDLAFSAKDIIFAVGRAGSRFFTQWCKKNKVGLINNQVDIGVASSFPPVCGSIFPSESMNLRFGTAARDMVIRRVCFVLMNAGTLLRKTQAACLP